MVIVGNCLFSLGCCVRALLRPILGRLFPGFDCASWEIHRENKSVPIPLYYDPATGRYLTSDPIGIAGGLNTYLYVGANPLKYVDPLGLLITGQWDGFEATVTGWDYIGLTPHLERGPGGNDLVDRLGYFNFLVSGMLGARVKCKETDDCGNVKREWTLDGSVSVNDIDFRVPYDEPAIPIPGMGAVIFADKVLRTGQYLHQWRALIQTAGKALLNTPTLICRGDSFVR